RPRSAALRVLDVAHGHELAEPATQAAAGAAVDHRYRVDRAEIARARLVGESLLETERGAPRRQRIAVDVATGQAKIDRVIVVHHGVADSRGEDAVDRFTQRLDGGRAHLGSGFGVFRA